VSLRTRLALLLVASAFALFAFGYIKYFLRPLPYGIILVEAEGLSHELLAAARLHRGDGNALFLDGFARAGHLSVSADDALIPDAPAAATALATGRPAPLGSVGLSESGGRLDNLVYEAQRRGRPTGLITTGEVTDPGAAAFFSHQSDARARLAVAAQFVDTSKLDLLLGGGARHFQLRSRSPSGERADGRDLLKELDDRDVTIVRTREELDRVSDWSGSRLVGLFADGPFAFQADLERWWAGRREPTGQPRLKTMVAKAISVLQRKSYTFPNGRIRGYFLVVHTGALARALEANQGQRAVREVIELDEALRTAREYAGRNTLIVVCSSRNIGGFALSGNARANLPGDRLFAEAGLSPAFTTGPGGPPTNGSQRAEVERRAESEPGVSDPSAPDYRHPAALYRSAAESTFGDVPAFADGQGADLLPTHLSYRDLHRFLRAQM
jgi:alkaline phosphatase